MAGTGPKNLPRTVAQASVRVRTGKPGVRAARSPRMSAGKASAGFGNPPGGAASGTPKATTPMASTSPRNVSKAKSTMKSKGTRVGTPRADFPSKI